MIRLTEVAGDADRWTFLVNSICFVLLPGRVFSVLTRLGVPPKVAWYWMWLLPSGYCYLLQAASAILLECRYDDYLLEKLDRGLQQFQNGVIDAQNNRVARRGRVRPA